jgi:hypothetical protein
MLVILISAAWFAIMAFTVVICRCAAHADALAAATPMAPSETPLQPDAAARGRVALIVFEPAPRQRRLHARRRRRSGSARAGSTVRARSGHCAAGS